MTRTEQWIAFVLSAMAVILTVIGAAFYLGSMMATEADVAGLREEMREMIERSEAQMQELRGSWSITSTATPTSRSGTSGSVFGPLPPRRCAAKLPPMPSARSRPPAPPPEPEQIQSPQRCQRAPEPWQPQAHHSARRRARRLGRLALVASEGALQLSRVGEDSGGTPLCGPADAAVAPA